MAKATFDTLYKCFENRSYLLLKSISHFQFYFRIQ